MEGNLSIERMATMELGKTVFQQVKNNSIVIFSPNNDTLHAVKANYNHLLHVKEHKFMETYGIMEPTLNTD